LLRREPRAGDVFVYRLEVRGLPDTRYVPPRPGLY
jgi:hypothetical protein